MKSSIQPWVLNYFYSSLVLLNSSVPCSNWSLGTMNTRCSGVFPFAWPDHSVSVVHSRWTPLLISLTPGSLVLFNFSSPEHLLNQFEFHGGKISYILWCYYATIQPLVTNSGVYMLALINNTFSPIFVFDIGMKIVPLLLIILDNQIIFSYVLCFEDSILPKIGLNWSTNNQDIELRTRLQKMRPCKRPRNTLGRSVWSFSSPDNV
jgi:hypothetical protein